MSREFLEGLIYERRPGWSEGWVRVSLERTPDGPRVVIEQAYSTVVLVPAAHVLAGIAENLRGLRPDELASGRAVLGPVGARVLERLGRAPGRLREVSCSRTPPAGDRPWSGSRA